MQTEAATRTKRAPRRRRTQHPRFPAPWRATPNLHLVWVHSALENDAANSHLEAMATAAALCARSNGAPQTQALRVSQWATRQEANKCFETAKHRGLLLFCFHGTTALEGGAA